MLSSKTQSDSACNNNVPRQFPKVMTAQHTFIRTFDTDA
jgi:hypothetical protein